MRKIRYPAAFVVVALLGGLIAPAVQLASRAVADTLTMSVGPTRSSWYSNQPALAPSAVNATHFGRLFTATLDGQVYAQPLVSKGQVLAVTENNDAYGIDAVTGSISWHHNYGHPFDPSVLGCGDLEPTIGITATPVIDPATNIAYFTTKIASSDSSTSAWYMHAVNVATGVEQANFPVLIQGNARNDAGTTFDAQHEMQRTGLALVNGVVYAGFGAHCDVPPYLGWVAGVSTSGSLTSMWADETGQSSGGAAGLWQSGAAPVVDASGHLYFITGNGTTAPVGPGLGQPQPQGLGECAIKLNTATGGQNGTLSIADWFCPAIAHQLNNYDGDFGAGGPTALPASFESAADNFPMMVAAGKEGVIYLMNMNDLGGVAQGPGGTDNVVAKVGPYGGVWSKPAVWGGNGGYVYLPTAAPAASGSGSSGQLLAFHRVLDGAGHVGLSLVASAPSAFGFSSSSPVVTSDGTTSGSAIVWIVHVNGSSGVGATLQAYEAVPHAGRLQQLWSAPLGNPGTGAKFNPPAVDNGRVYVGTRDGTVLGFGALPGAPKLQADFVSFAPATLGQSSTATATFTATGSITVNSVAASSTGNVFATGTPVPALPVSLTTGEQVTVPVTFTPSALGLQTGTLTANTGQGAVDLPLDGVGVAPTVPISSTPASVNFGTRPIGGAPSTTTLTFTNTGSSSFTITGLGAPGGPFTLANAPATDGSVSVAAGDSIGLDVTFTPPATSGSFAQTFSGKVELDTDVGNVLVPVKGVAAPPAQISISPTTLRFGTVAIGQNVVRSFTVANNGGVPLTILKSKPPVANKFGATTTLSEGTVIPPHRSVIEHVRFSPSAAGALQDHWIINGNDTTGVQVVHFTGTGARLATVPPPPSGGWALNGSAVQQGATLQLTPASNSKAGSAFWPHPLSSSVLHASFTATIGGGGGADGMTIAFADAAKAKPTALGGNGALLGFGGIPGVAVALDTYPNATNTVGNSVGVVTGVSGAGLRWSRIDANVPQLRTGSHLIAVDAVNGKLTVSVDGFTEFTQSVNLPPTVLLGFTGGTGGLSDRHLVTNVQIAANTVAVPKPAPLGYRLAGSDGGVFVYGAARYYGSTGGMHLNRPIVGMASDPKTGGYWMVASDGGIFAFHAPFFGSTGAMHLNAPIVGMAATPDGRGYWLVASDGGVFAFGDARFHGSTGAMHLNAPIVAMAASPRGGGYWLVASDGGIFGFAAGFFGSTGAMHLNAPITGMAAMPDGRGYRLVAADGGVFDFGSAGSFGSAAGRAGGARVVGIGFTPDGRGYWEVGSDGAVFNFGDARFLGAANGSRLSAPIVGIGA